MAAKKTPAKKTSTKKPPAAKKRASGLTEAPDPRFIPVAKAFARTPGFSLMETKSGVTRGLMLDGKSFGMSSHGRLLLKLDEERAAALIAQGVGEPFHPTPGRVMKGWIDVTHPQADWVALAKEAYRLASEARKRAATKAKR